MKRFIIGAAAVLAASVCGVGSSYAGKTLDAIKARDKIKCGISTGNPGWSAPDSAGVWHGIDVDLCRALAAALFGDSKKVEYIPQNFGQVVAALQSGETDVVTRPVTWTIGRETALGLDFPVVHYISGQTFMVPKKLNITKPEELNGATICVHTGSTSEANMNDFFKERNLTYKQVLFEDQNLLYAAYEAGRCDAVTTEPPTLAARRSVFKDPAEHVILKGFISKEPFSPVVRQGDDEWRKLVRSTVYAMIAAEEMGITSANVKDIAAKSANAEQRRLLGAEGEIGTKMGLKNSWVVDIISQVGNYGEVFARNVGPGTRLNMERGLSELWTKGGMLQAPPFR